MGAVGEKFYNIIYSKASQPEFRGTHVFGGEVSGFPWKHFERTIYTVDSRYSEVGYNESPDIVNGKICRIWFSPHSSL